MGRPQQRRAQRRLQLIGEMKLERIRLALQIARLDQEIARLKERTARGLRKRDIDD